MMVMVRIEPTALLAGDGRWVDENRACTCCVLWAVLDGAKICTNSFISVDHVERSYWILRSKVSMTSRVSFQNVSSIFPSSITESS